MPSRGQHFQAEEVSLVCSGSCWVTKGGPHPRGIHSRVQAALCLSFWGPLSGKWGCGQNSVCPMGCQEDSSSHVDRMRASDGSATSGLRVPVRSEGPGPWPWTAQIPLGQGVGPRVGQLWPWLRKSTVASIPTTWGMQPCQGPSLPTAAAGTQPGTEEARAAATTVFSGQGCTGSGHSRVSSAHTCLRHTSACLILAGAWGAHAYESHIQGLVGTPELFAHECPCVLGVMFLPSLSESGSRSLHPLLPENDTVSWK